MTAVIRVPIEKGGHKYFDISPLQSTILLSE